MIEKTPEKTAIYYPEGDQLIVANHFQSEILKNSPLNIDHIRDSESMPRFERMSQLTSQDTSISVANTLRYIRDRKGVDGKELGTGNPMAINQLLAHHSVIFEPIKGLVYISVAPFQENVFNAYAINSIKNMGKLDPSLPPEIDSLQLKQDSFFTSNGFLDYQKYKLLKADFLAMSNKEIPGNEFIENWISTNPEYYEPYFLLGNYYFENKDFPHAKTYYVQALSKAIPYRSIKTQVNENLAKMK